jgi:nucleotide-binding universal stress UspA family protein
MADRILVPFDGSENSEKGLKYACLLANKLGATITVLYVVNIPSTGDSAVLNIRSLISEGRKVLETAKKIVEEENCVHARYYLRHGVGNPAHEIIKLSKEGAFSTVVMSATGHTALSHLLMGSVSDTVVHHAPCTVVIVR